jgi:hypothetical protein
VLVLVESDGSGSIKIGGPLTRGNLQALPPFKDRFRDAADLVFDPGLVLVVFGKLPGADHRP